MQMRLSVDDTIYQEAQAEAARLGETLPQFVEESLRQRIALCRAQTTAHKKEIEERNQLMETLLRRTAHFRIGPKPSRAEMNER